MIFLGQGQNKMEWHKVFAYFPLQLTNGGWVWLETVSRKLIVDECGGGYIYEIR
jgi:hypothetical protein